MLTINPRLSIPLEEIELSAVRSQGAGGQSVNKTSSAVHLRFDLAKSSLPPEVKARLLALRDQRVSGDGVIVIKAQQTRSQEQNRVAALERLRVLIDAATRTAKPRKATRPSKAARRQRVDSKTRRGAVKSLRGRIRDD